MSLLVACADWFVLGYGMWVGVSLVVLCLFDLIESVGSFVAFMIAAEFETWVDICCLFNSL